MVTNFWTINLLNLAFFQWSHSKLLILSSLTVFFQWEPTHNRCVGAICLKSLKSFWFSRNIAVVTLFQKAFSFLPLSSVLDIIKDVSCNHQQSVNAHSEIFPCTFLRSNSVVIAVPVARFGKYDIHLSEQLSYSVESCSSTSHKLRPRQCSTKVSSCLWRPCAECVCWL